MVYFCVSEEAKVVALRRVLQEAGFPCVYGRDEVLCRVEDYGTVRARPSHREILVWVEDEGGTQLASVLSRNEQQAVGAWSLALDLLVSREEYLG